MPPQKDYEAEEERRATSDEPAGEDGEQPENNEPPLPDEAEMKGLGFSPSPAEEKRYFPYGLHSIEEAMPLASHVLLAREALRHEMDSANPALEGAFRLLDRSLAMRLRYRHFLAPPLVNVDVVVSTIPDRDKIDIPDKWDFLSQDLNTLSKRNRQIAAEAPDEEPEHGVKKAGYMCVYDMYVYIYIYM